MYVLKQELKLRQVNQCICQMGHFSLGHADNQIKPWCACVYSCQNVAKMSKKLTDLSECIIAWDLCWNEKWFKIIMWEVKHWINFTVHDTNDYGEVLWTIMILVLCLKCCSEQARGRSIGINMLKAFCLSCHSRMLLSSVS